MDLFASRQNTQHPNYYSWEHDFAARGVDSLAHPWHWKSTLYAYPPTFLIARVMQKIIQERVYDMILITPLFSLQSWWPVLLETLIEIPIVLPMRPELTTDPAGRPTYKHTWPLMAWRISGDLKYARQRRRSMRAGKTAMEFQQWIRKSTRLLLPKSRHIRNEHVLVRSILTTQFHT